MKQTPSLHSSSTCTFVTLCSPCNRPEATDTTRLCIIISIIIIYTIRTYNLVIQQATVTINEAYIRVNTFEREQQPFYGNLVWLQSLHDSRSRIYVLNNIFSEIFG